MKKIVVKIIFGLLILAISLFYVDYNSVKSNEKPMFSISFNSADDGGSGDYYGLFYRTEVEYENLEMNNTKMYIFENIIAESSSLVTVESCFSEYPEEIMNGVMEYLDDEMDNLNIDSGVYEIVNGESQMIGEIATYDEYKINSLEFIRNYDLWAKENLVRTENRIKENTYDVYRLDYLMHTTTPEKVTLAGAMEIYENNWVLTTYPNATYLVFNAETNEFIISTMVNDFSPNTEQFDNEIKSLLHNLN